MVAVFPVTMASISTKTASTHTKYTQVTLIRASRVVTVKQVRRVIKKYLIMRLLETQIIRVRFPDHNTMRPITLIRVCKMKQ